MRKAERLGAVVVDEFVDAGESARTADRPELQRMLAYVRTRSLRHRPQVDRLARNRADDVEINLAIQRPAPPGLADREHRRDAERPAAARHHELDRRVLQPEPRQRGHQGHPQKARTAARRRRRRSATSTSAASSTAARYAPSRSTRTGRLMPWAFEEYATGDWSLSRLAEAAGAARA